MVFVPNCRLCKGELVSIENWYKYYEEHRDFRCISCMRDISREYARRNKEIKNASQREFYKILKHEILSYYSGGTPRCACCGEEHLEFLSIDHINGGGGKHRQKLHAWGKEFYRWLKKNNYPTGYRVLCFNCNLALGFFGYCPHNNL